MQRSLTMLLALGLLWPVLAFAADWQQFLGPNRNGISPETGINQVWGQKPPKVLWKTALSDGGYAGPSAAGGKVFIVDHRGTQDVVRALHLNSGKDIWSFSYDEPAGNNYGFARATPTVSDGKVYTISRSGQVHCLNAGNGKKLWSRNLVADFRGQKPQWDYSMSALVDGNKVIVCPGGPNAAVAALDKNSGKTLWQGGNSDLPGYATPVTATLNGVKQYVVFTAYNLLGVDAGSGKLLWSYPWKTGCDVNAATPIVYGNSVFITSGYGHGCALIEVNGRIARTKWVNKEMQSQFASPILSGGVVYGTCGDQNRLACLDLATGRVRWQQRGFEKGGIIAVAGAFIVMDGRSGDVVMAWMRPTGYQELGRMKPLGGQSWTAPILADGKLIVRNTKMLACLDLK